MNKSQSKLYYFCKQAQKRAHKSRSLRFFVNNSQIHRKGVNYEAKRTDNAEKAIKSHERLGACLRLYYRLGLIH